MSAIEPEQGELECFPIMHRLDNTELWNALNQLNDRELYVLLERAVEEKTFDELASELNIGYKALQQFTTGQLKKLEIE